MCDMIHSLIDHTEKLRVMETRIAKLLQNEYSAYIQQALQFLAKEIKNTIVIFFLCKMLQLKIVFVV